MNLSQYQTAAMRTAAGAERTDKQLLLWALALLGEAGEVLRLVIRAYADAHDVDNYDGDERLMLTAAFLGHYAGELCDAIKKRIGHKHDVPDSELRDILDKAWRAQEQVYSAIDGNKVNLPKLGFSTPPNPEEFADEIGDVLWHCAALSYLAGMDLNGVAEYNLEKLRERYGNAFSFEKSRNRVR